MVTQASGTVRTVSKIGILATTALSLCLGFTGIAAAVIDPVPIPELERWKTNLSTFGKQHCSAFSNGATVDDTYFDAERVYYQIPAYLGGDPTLWRTCANQAEALYRDGMVRPAPESVPGDWVYSLGLRMDYMGTTDTVSQSTVQILADQSPWASSTTPESATQSYDMSREVALALMAYVDSMALGGAKPAKYDAFVNQALGHIDQWYVQRLWEQVGNFPHYPFTVGFTMQALIQAHSHQADGRIPAKIKIALDGLWDSAWLANANAFYMDNWSLQAEPNFNLLIAPAYAWYYLETGDVVYRDRADQIFAGGVRQASLDMHWQFNVNYVWSFDYVIWREAANIKYSTPPPPPPGSQNAAPVCTAAQARPAILWPPNHKMVPIQVVGITDADKDPIALKVKKVSQDEPTKGLGRRDLSPDVYSKGGILYLRAERWKKGDGREYDIQFEAEDGKGGTCSGVVKVKVPRKRSKFDGWKHDDDDDDDDRDNKSHRNHDNDRHDGKKKGDRDDDDKNKNKKSGRDRDDD